MTTRQDTGAEPVATSEVAAGKAERGAAVSTEQCSLSALRAARAKMTPGEWSDEEARDELCANAVPDDDDAFAIVVTHNAADVLIEIAEAALALRAQERKAERMRFDLDCYKGRGIPDSVLIEAANTEVRLDVCRNAYDAALAKVRP